MASHLIGRRGQPAPHTSPTYNAPGRRAPRRPGLCGIIDRCNAAKPPRVHPQGIERPLMRARHIVLSGLMLLFALLLVVTRPADPTYTVSAVAAPAPSHLTHPCSGMLGEPTFTGLAPLSISWVPGMCTSDVYQSGYGDITVWQAGGHDYVGLSGFAQRAFHIFNVDDPYHPVLLVSQLFPAGGTASTSIFAFKQGGAQYLSFTMRGSGSGCGFFVYNVDNPAAPQYMARKAGSDWCTVHESFVSSDAQGNADYAWLTMSAESGSGYK